MAKIIILNVGWSNKGNVALVKSTMENIKAFLTDVEFCLVGIEDNIKNYGLPIKEPISRGLSIKKPIYTLETLYYLFICVFFYLFKRIRINLQIPKSSRLYNYYKSDIIINSGGDALSGETGFGSTVIFLNIIYGILLCKPVVLYSESLGYFESGLMNLLSKIVFNNVKLILVREELSKKYLDKIGVNKPNIQLIPDSAFTLKETSKSIIFHILKREEVNVENQIITINPSGLIHRHIQDKKMDLYEIMAKTVDYLIDTKNVNIILIPHVYSYDSDDRIVINNIFSRVKNKSHVYTVDGEYLPEELKGIISLSELFIGMRMHSMIGATSLCIPTVAIAYSHKTRGIIGKMLGQEEYVIDVNDLEYYDFISKIDAAWDNRNKIKRDLENKIPYIKEQSLSGGKLVKELINH